MFVRVLGLLRPSEADSGMSRELIFFGSLRPSFFEPLSEVLQWWGRRGTVLSGSFVVRVPRTFQK